jgi:hypothetical protein
MQFPKRFVYFFNPRRWTKSRTPVILSVIHHCQNPDQPVGHYLSDLALSRYFGNQNGIALIVPTVKEKFL